MKSTPFFIVTLLVFWHTAAFGQNIVFSGIVIDSGTAQPLPYASVGIKGTSIGTATNNEGKFAFAVPESYSDSTLLCSFMGYKDFILPLSTVKNSITIRLVSDIITLKEVMVRPWEPWQYVQAAMKKMSANYAQDAYMTEGYYSESVQENGQYLKFTEGVVETYYPAYGDTMKSQSRVLQARRRDNLVQLQFMRDKLEKKMDKEQKKAVKKGEEPENGDKSIDEMILSSSFGGPETMVGVDPLRDTSDYLDEKKMKRYSYDIEGYTRYHSDPVIIIGFESKGVTDHQRKNGKIYISLTTDAIISIESNTEIVIPGIARPVIFFAGYGITNPVINGVVHYKTMNGRWYLSDISIEGGTRITDSKLFKKDDRSTFHIEMALINNRFSLDDVHEIPEKERIDPEKPLEEQVEPDPGFWRNYTVSRPANVFE